MSHLLHYWGLYKETIQYDEKYFFTEKIATRCAGFDWRVAPHFHSQLFQIFYVEEGYSKVTINTDQYDLTGPYIILLPPNHFHGFQFQNGVEGKIISFSKFYTKSLSGAFPSIESDLKEVLVISGLKSKEQYKNVIRAIEDLEDEFLNGHKYREIAISVLIANLLIQTMRLSEFLHTIKNSNMGNADIKYFIKFKELIKTEQFPFQPLTEYAKKIGISCSKLNKVCREVQHLSPLQIIQNELVQNVEAYLYNKDMNIQEIAYNLGFKDPSYLTRLFKKKTGFTPKEYRNRLEMQGNI